MLPGRLWFGLILVVCASLAIVLGAIWFASGRAPQGPNPSRPVAAPDKIRFAEGARSANEDLNAFIEQFVTHCVEQDYDAFRLCWTSYSKPLSRKQFENMWDLVQQARIVAVEPVPADAKVMHPAYIIGVQVSIDPAALAYRRQVKIDALAPEELRREVEILVQREGDRWAIGLPPRRDALAQTQPTAEAASDTQPPAAE